MKIKSSEYLSQWKYVEVAQYVPSLNKIIRKQRNKVPILFEWGGEEIETYRRECNDTGVYHSIWYYDHTDIDLSTRFASLYFDLDSSDINQVQEETIELVNYLTTVIPESAIRVYFTGKKGFHVHCESWALGIVPTNELPRLFRYIARQLRNQLSLSTIDFSVYDNRRMWRFPNSKHQSTGLYKVELGDGLFRLNINDIISYAKNPHFDKVQLQSGEFSLTANRWFTEIEQCYIEECINRFNKLGTKILHTDEDQTISGLLRVLSQSAEGERNSKLNWSSYHFGRHVALGHITEEDAIAQLYEVAMTLDKGNELGWDREVMATIRSGITAGLQSSL